MLGDVAFAQAPFASQGGNTFNAAISETGSINFDTAVSSYIGVATNAESVSASAVQSALVAFAASVSETASGGAVFDTLNNTFNVAFSDTVSGSSSFAVQADFAAAVQEAVSTNSSVTNTANFVATVLEAASASAESLGGLLLLVSINEAASGLDAYANTVATTAFIEELAAALDNLGVVKTANVSVTGVQLVVSIGNVLIWSTVNDNQDPNWQNMKPMKPCN